MAAGIISEIDDITKFNNQVA
ncbi:MULTISPECIES: hypothetical protein [Clostridium]|nr:MULTISPECIES: hypothetical protein [Clostridium]